MGCREMGLVGGSLWTLGNSHTSWESRTVTSVSLAVSCPARCIPDSITGQDFPSPEEPGWWGKWLRKHRLAGTASQGCESCVYFAPHYSDFGSLVLVSCLVIYLGYHQLKLTEEECTLNTWPFQLRSDSSGFSHAWTQDLLWTQHCLCSVRWAPLWGSWKHHTWASFSTVVTFPNSQFLQNIF